MERLGPSGSTTVHPPFRITIIPSFSNFTRHLPAASARWFGQRSRGKNSEEDLQRAVQAIAFALPQATAEQHQKIAHDSLQKAAADQALQEWASGQDDRQLCRRLELRGWDHLTSEQPTIFAIAPAGLPCLAVRILALYRNAADAQATPHDELANQIAEGNSIACRLDAPHEPRQVPWLEGEARVSTLPARLALEHGLPLVPVIAQGTEADGLRFKISPPIQPNTASVADLTVADLTATCLAAWATEVADAPALWHWCHLPTAEPQV